MAGCCFRSLVAVVESFCRGETLMSPAIAQSFMIAVQILATPHVDSVHNCVLLFKSSAGGQGTAGSCPLLQALEAGYISCGTSLGMGSSFLLASVRHSTSRVLPTWL